MSFLGPLLLLLLLPSSPLTASSPQPSILEYKDTIAKTILSSLERGTLFLERTKGHLKMSTMIYLQILQVELQGVQEAWAVEPVPEPLFEKVRILSERLMNLRSSSFDHLNQSEPVHVQEFLPIIQLGFWKLPHIWTDTNASKVFPTTQFSGFLMQDSSSQCVVELLGTRVKDSQPCSYSPLCEALLTTYDGSDHYLSHQVFYFLLSRMIGCTEGLFKETQHFLDHFCAKMMNLNQKADAERHPDSHQELFMQNILFCGLGGFVDFYKFQWLKTILNWQNPQKGCFMKTDACTTHRTAVAVGALGGFLYVLAKHPEAYERSFQPTSSPNTIAPR
ncbi:PREDICTED: UPF0764 protein C16orf89 homolog [Elephantulus edwardii]|uniref:UPF0764 protein C16orf89 homolog n=1 Tax=Elephantulus edwardii TaxID=28737 RepID=UPI0003F08D70|nr:PREDICTED: UPF0764 protein C16orf89 homolog [Elephantulus edwardii]